MMPKVLVKYTERSALSEMIIESGNEMNVGFRMHQVDAAEISNDITSFDWRHGVRTAPENPRYKKIKVIIKRRTHQFLIT